MKILRLLLLATSLLAGVSSADVGVKRFGSIDPDELMYTKEGVDAAVVVSTNGLASEDWVLGQGYVTESVTNGLASKTWVDGHEWDWSSVTNKPSIVYHEEDPVFTAWKGSNLYVRTVHSGPVVIRGSFSVGEDSNAFSNKSGAFAEGKSTVASSAYTHAAGWGSHATNELAWVWNGVRDTEYGSHGRGTFSLNPADGLSGFWIGDTTISNHISSMASSEARRIVRDAVSDISTDIRTAQDARVALTNLITRLQNL